MMTLMKKMSYTAAAGLLLSASAINMADTPSGVYLAPGIHYQDVFGKDILGKDVGLEGDVGLNLGLGYQFNPNWGIELMYHRTDTEITRTSKTQLNADDEMDTNYAHLDVLYHMNTASEYWSPYIVGGIGRQSYSANWLDKADAQLNAGVGVKYAMSDNLYFRTDARATVGGKEGDVGGIFTMGLMVFFGSTSSSSAAPVVRPEPVVQEPEPVEELVEVVEAVIIAPVVVDSDGDGVPDDLDQCPGTSAGAKVDEQGCYEVLTETKEFTLNVTFASGSSVINADSKADVESLATFLTSYPNTNVVIEGHSDSTGSAALNKRLSQQRADAVKQSLVDEYAISEGRIATVGYGMERPIADNGTVEGRAKNRRVVAKVSALVVKIIEE